MTNIESENNEPKNLGEMNFTIEDWEDALKSEKAREKELFAKLQNKFGLDKPAGDTSK